MEPPPQLTHKQRCSLHTKLGELHIQDTNIEEIIHNGDLLCIVGEVTLRYFAGVDTWILTEREP